MKLPVRSEIMESLVRERKENQREEKLLQEEIDRILKAKALAEGTSQSEEELAELNERLEKLSEEKENLVRKRKDLCSMARSVGAGD